MAVERREVLAQLAEIEEPIDAAQQMIRGNVIVEVERVEQLVLAAACCPIISTTSVVVIMPRHQQSFAGSIEFFNGIDPKQTLVGAPGWLVW